MNSALVQLIRDAFEGSATDVFIIEEQTSFHCRERASFAEPENPQKKTSWF